jgi:fimbrial chaperone protein
MFRSMGGQAAFGLALLLVAQAAGAGSFGISPLRVTLTSERPAGMLTVRNQSADETIVQLQPHTWSQQDGTDRLEPTTDLIAVPPLFTLPPGGSQVVRLGLRRPPPVAGESSYRLLLREVPPPPPEGFTGLQVVLNLNLPVFVLPAGGARPELSWALGQSTAGGLELRLSNLGDAHVQIKSLHLARDGIAALRGYDLPVYLLPGQSRAWRFDSDAPPGRWTLSARTDARLTETELVVMQE